MLDAEINGDEIVLINNEGAGKGPLNVDLPDMLNDAGFSLLADGFERNPMDENGDVRVDVIPEDVPELVEWLEDNFLSDQPAFAKLKDR